ncbi:MAG TPA: hypothetical protein VFN35_13165 [Ktedonobacteraceae bacterium]|nr:hypothetical protein [Ktedonobacteraceae bacterium]
MNQRQSEELSTALEELCHQSELILDGALERMEHANSQRLQGVYARLEQVTVTLEQSQVLPAVPAPSTRLLAGRSSSPRTLVNREHENRSHPQMSQEDSSVFTSDGANQESERSDGLQSFDSKVN